jgi:hypothetical protein
MLSHHTILIDRIPAPSLGMPAGSKRGNGAEEKEGEFFGAPFEEATKTRRQETN